jgi:hypothetical protein
VIPRHILYFGRQNLVLNSWFLLQGNEIRKSKSRLDSSVDSNSIQTIRSRVPGNTHCADCDASSMYLQSDHRAIMFMLAAFCCKLPTLHISPLSTPVIYQEYLATFLIPFFFTCNSVSFLL